MINFARFVSFIGEEQEDLQSLMHIENEEKSTVESLMSEMTVEKSSD